mmetsp:Transcript_38888/g.83731  ORF Transcript_38888/g.83731 Transcript_38888/m.83731 type:complete len:94 (+) Transcript_38888:265-546(+)
MYRLGFNPGSSSQRNAVDVGQQSCLLLKIEYEQKPPSQSRAAVEHVVSALPRSLKHTSVPSAMIGVSRPSLEIFIVVYCTPARSYLAYATPRL